MKATCPVCGFYSALEGFLALEDYKQAIGIMSEMGGDETVKLVIRYLGLFRKPNSDRALTGSRVLKLTRELRDYFRAENIQWKQQRAHANAQWYWIQAIKKLLDRAEQGQVERPLTSHNLLRCLAYEIADKDFESRHRQKEMERSYRPDHGRTQHAQSEEQSAQRQASQAEEESEGSGQVRGPQEARDVAKSYIQKWREEHGHSA